MLERVKGFLSEYKPTVIKMTLAIILVAMIFQYNSYGKRSSAHHINLQLKQGNISRICIAPSKSISRDERGTYVVIEKKTFYIPDKWMSINPRDNLHLAIVYFNDSKLRRNVYEIDTINAELLLRDGRTEGCKSYINIDKRIVRP